MSNIVRLSGTKIAYNWELKLLERMVQEAIERDDTASSSAVINQSRKVDSLLMRLIEEAGAK